MTKKQKKAQVKREWDIKNKNHVSKYRKKYRAENREKIAKQQKKYYRLNLPDIKIRREEYHARRRLTPLGRIELAYRFAKGRVTNKKSPKYRWYCKLEIMPREEFVKWSINDPDFNRLFDNWEKSGYEYKLTPTPDRLDIDKGYIKNNIEWVTMSENCRRAREKGGSNG